MDHIGGSTYGTAVVMVVDVAADEEVVVAVAVAGDVGCLDCTAPGWATAHDEKNLRH